MAPPAGASPGVRAGAGATVNAGRGDCLNVRAEPSRAARAITCLADGTVVTITAGPREADSITWWQIDGGGWAIYPGGPTEVSASVKAYFVLKLLGDRPEDAHMVHARAAIRELGGLDACNSFTKIYLSIFGQYDWDRCPSVPPELVLFPRWFYFNLYEMSSWSRAILVPLSIISARRPSCAASVSSP